MRIAIFAAALSLIVGAMGLVADDRPEPKRHTITIEGMKFEPDRLTVAAGDIVVWINKDLVPHTATSGAGGFDSKMIESDKSWSFTARKQGEAPYVCTYHPTMKAVLEVE